MTADVQLLAELTAKITIGNWHEARLLLLGHSPVSAEYVKEVLRVYAEQSFKGHCECSFASFRLGSPGEVETLLAIPRT